MVVANNKTTMEQEPQPPARRAKKRQRSATPYVHRSAFLLIFLSQVVWTRFLFLVSEKHEAGHEAEMASASSDPPSNLLFLQHFEASKGQKNAAQKSHRVLGAHENETMNGSSTLSLPLYVQQHCNLTGVNHWMVKESDRLQRVPAFIIMGTKKAGTTALFHTLLQHPQIVKGRTKELQFFVPNKQFRRYWENGVGSKVQVVDARKDLIHKHFRQAVKHIEEQQQSLPSSYTITGEATPDYLIFPDYASQAILCTAPWVKLIIVLRDPLDRLFSHYNYLKDPSKGIHRPGMPSFEEWVMGDIRVLQSTGVLPQNLSNLEMHMGSSEEREGWRNYQRLVKPGKATPGSDRHVCRSLYAPQLEILERHLNAIGKEFGKHVKIVLSRDLLHDDDGNTTKSLVSWLGLEPQNGLAPRRSMITQYTSPAIRPEFRDWLQFTLFKPFNQRLYRFLGSKYDGIFDHQEKVS